MADTKYSALTAVSTVAGSNEIGLNEAGTSKKANIDQVGDYFIKRIAGSSGAAGNFITWQNLTANATTNTSTTPATAITTTGVGAGTWKYKYSLIYQTAATTTGVGFCINHTGTTGAYVMNWQFVGTGTTQSTGVADQVQAVNAGTIVEGKAERVINTVSSASAGVDTANSNCLAILEGIIVVTASGDLQLKYSTEVAASGVTLMADSCLELCKIE